MIYRSNFKVSTIWTMWLISSLFYSYQYILRVLPNIIMPEILEKFSISACCFGQISGVYYIGYAILHIPIGIALDKFGPKKVLPLCMMLTAIGTAPLIFSDNWIHVLIGRILVGIGSSGAILGIFKIIRLGFKEEKFANILGFSVTIGLLGAIYGGYPVRYLITQFGWQNVLLAVSAIGFIFALITFAIVPSTTEQYQKSETSTFNMIKSVMSNFKILAVCLLAGLMVGPLEGFADVWGTSFFKSVYAMSENKAAFLPSLIFIGMCFGAPVLSYIAEKTNSYYAFIIVSAIVIGASFIGMLSGKLPTGSLVFILPTIGVFCAYQILAIYKACSYVSENLVGLTTALANMIIMLFGYLFHSIIGKLVDYSWDGTMLNGIPVYTGYNYTIGLSAIPIGLIIAAIGFLLIANSDRKLAKI